MVALMRFVAYSNSTQKGQAMKKRIPKHIMMTFLTCCLLSVLWLGESCAPTQTCTGEFGPTTINPSGSPCTQKCDCNNQSYSGECVDGTCTAIARGSCEKKGEIAPCVIQGKEDQKCGGTKICQPEGLTTSKWGDCTPINQIPAENTVKYCFDGIDNDCDGKVDRVDSDCNPFCTTNSTEECESSKDGECKKGKRTCGDDGQWGECISTKEPGTESCNDKDDDCDGRIDEDFKEGSQPLGDECSDGKGVCKTIGKYECTADGTGTFCSAKAKDNASKEKCNEKDDDCDGEVDEDFPEVGKVCEVGQGECKETGLNQCTANGLGVECNAKEKAPTTEKCNDKDDDCDGKIDEDFTDLNTGCEVGKGECRATGLFKCKADGSGVECPAKPKTPASQEACDGKDDDCDGSIDEGCSCLDGSTQACGSDVGECKKGIQTCKGGQWGACGGEITASAEVCNGKDDNCDGSVDEKPQDAELGKTCTDSSKKGLCTQGVKVCKQGAIVCESTVTPKNESCNGKDDDCDGQIDNKNAGQSLCATDFECQAGQCVSQRRCVTTQTIGQCTSDADCCNGSKCRKFTYGSFCDCRNGETCPTHSGKRTQCCTLKTPISKTKGVCISQGASVPGFTKSCN